MGILSVEYKLTCEIALQEELQAKCPDAKLKVETVKFERL